MGKWQHINCSLKDCAHLATDDGQEVGAHGLRASRAPDAIPDIRGTGTSPLISEIIL